MKDFWENIKKLFQSAESSTPSQPVIHNLIVRSVEFDIEFEQWKKKSSKRRILDWIKNEYNSFIFDEGNNDKSIGFLDTPSAKGFVIHFNQTNYSEKEITFLFDYLKEKVKEVGYKTYMSDTRTYNRPNWVERVDKHYLKPFSDQKNPQKGNFNQAYGNITIELLYRNEEVWNLKFRAVSYNDRMYKKAESFKQLMSILLS